jgi:hypothetical protein
MAAAVCDSATRQGTSIFGHVQIQIPLPAQAGILSNPLDCFLPARTVMSDPSLRFPGCPCLRYCAVRELGDSLVGEQKANTMRSV